MATKTADLNITGLLDQATQTFSESFKAGVKMQEDVAKWWSETLDQAGPVQEWQKRSRAIVSEAIPAAQRQAEEWLKVLEENYARSMDLLKKAMSSEGNGNAVEMQAKVRDLWEASLGVLKDNAQALAQTNMKMMDVWADVLRKNVSAAVKTAAGSVK
jgi:hypothetical protein